MNANAKKITGVKCGYPVKEIENPFMRNVRCPAKMIEEPARGKAMEKTLRL